MIIDTREKLCWTLLFFVIHTKYLLFIEIILFQILNHPVKHFILPSNIV